MPTIENAKTISASQSWQSPDGKIKSYDVVFDISGKEFKAQTYSSVIAVVGWTGNIETYEKKGYTYVKQPPKEDTYSGGSSKPKEVDPFTMYLSYAKDIVIALINSGDYTKAKVDQAFSDTIKGGRALYERRPGAEESEARELASEVSELPLDG